MVMHTGALKKIRSRLRNSRIQWGRWDCKSKEMIVGIICLVEVLKLNHKAIVWQIILPDYLAGVHHYVQPDWLRYLHVSGQVIPSHKVV